MKTNISNVVGISLVIFTIAACQPQGEQNQMPTQEPENTTGMLQHTVYFYINEDVTPEQKSEFEDGLRELLSISSIYKAELGVPGETEERDVTDHSFAYSIFTWFETLEDYRIYDEHPDHLEFIDTYNALWSDVKVYDSELITPEN